MHSVDCPSKLDLLDLGYTLSLSLTDHFLPSCSVSAAASIFLQLCLNFAVHISDSGSLLQVFRGRTLLLWPCRFHCKACLAMLTSFCRNVCPTQLHFLLLIYMSTSSRSVVVLR